MDQNLLKEIVARVLAQRVVDGEVVGIGSGTTVQRAIIEIGARIKKEGIRVRAITTSHRSGLLAEEAGIEVLSSVSVTRMAWAFDGADEVDDNFNMIKGRGAAMLTEKIMARRSERLVIIVDENKLVKKLGEKFAIPVEVIPEAIGIVEEGLKKLGASAVNMRMLTETQRPMITEHNNLILDAQFNDIKPALENQIKSIVGVVESGLFIGCTSEVLVSKSDGVWQRKLEHGKTTETRLS